MKELDHPCKATCSGWSQAYEKGGDERQAAIVAWLKSFECVPATRADAKSAYQLAELIEQKFGRKK